MSLLTWTFLPGQVLEVEGPSVAMVAPYVYAPRNAPGGVEVSLTLTGQNTLPVDANLTLSLRTLQPGALPNAQPYFFGALRDMMLLSGALSHSYHMGADGSTLAAPAPADVGAALANAVILWQVGINRTQNVTLRWPGARAAADVQRRPAALVVAVSSVSNADLPSQLNTTVVSDVPPANLTAGYALQPNQVSCVQDL